MATYEPNVIADYAVGTSAVTTPLWMTALEQGIGWYVFIGGAILVTLRVAIAVKELLSKKSKE
jgi:hypothetical protein